MSTIKLGTKIRVLAKEAHPPYTHAGDIGVVVENARGLNPDTEGDYWVNLNGCGNPYVHMDGIWCVGKPGEHFEILEDSYGSQLPPQE